MAKKWFTDESLNAFVTKNKNYADSAATKVKNDLLNGAGAAYDTLKELGELIDENQDAIQALEQVATGKADKEHNHAISEVTDLQTALDSKAPAIGVAYIDENDNETVILGGDGSNLPSAEGVEF